MALAHFPKIITDGLIFAYDMSDPFISKSWKGRPITNQFAIPTPDSTDDVSFQVNGTGIFRRIYSGKYGDYTINPRDIVYRYNLGGAGCHYHGNDVSINAGQTATFSFDYFISPDATNYPTINFLANFEGVVSGSAVDPTPTIKGVWKRATFSATASGNGTCRMLLYPGACSGSYLASGGYILYKNPQVEFDAPGLIPSPFVAGTRSNTQAVLDLTNNNTITANSLTYNSDGTFSFNGSSNVISFPENSALNVQNPTIEVWVKTNALTQNGFWFEKGNVNTQYSFFQEGSNIQWRTHNGSTIVTQSLSSSNISTSNYSQCVATIEGGQKKIYVNGVLKASVAWSSTIPTNANGCSIGAYGGFNGGRGYYYNGSIGSVKVYNRALIAAEIAQNFQALRGRYGI